jgi:putative methionine-R-sulfoxide reductase with GAF domain
MIFRFVNNFFIRSWWVLVFILLCLFLYERGLKKREEQYQQLYQQLAALLEEKEAVSKIQQNLREQVNSQSDLAWIEMTLMKGLGLVPEGEQKVYFYKKE